MKRSSSTSIPELSPPRRKRGLSEEERALWESVAKQTKPLRKEHRAARPPVVDLPATEAPAAAKSAAPPKPPPSSKILRAPKPQVPLAAPPLAPLGRRERSQLS